MLPLQVITVVMLEHAIAAPYCTRQLADLGACVIKVERPGIGDFARGCDQRREWPQLALRLHQSQQGKSVAGPQAPADRRGAARMLAKVDVLVQNLAPGAPARLGLSYAALRDQGPRLIVCAISGYGGDSDKPGPYLDKKAYDLLILGEAGFLSVSGTADEPSAAGGSIADIAAGTMAYGNVLAALIERGRTGCGRHVDVSMLESMVE